MTPRAQKPREHSTNPIILSIPIELRQHILSYVFCEAIAQDVAFNAKLAKNIPEPALGASLFLSSLDDLNDPFFADDEYTGERSKIPVSRPPCAPRIYAMANKISAVHPQLKEEVKFVFKQCLEQFRS